MHLTLHRLEAESPEEMAAAAKQSELLAAQAKHARAAAALAVERQRRVDAASRQQQQPQQPPSPGRTPSRLGRTDSAGSLQGQAAFTPGDQPIQPGSAQGMSFSRNLCSLTLPDEPVNMC